MTRTSLSLIVAVVLPPAGIPLAVKSLRRIERTGERGRGLARAALVIGFVLTVIYVLAFQATAAFVGYSYWFLGGIPGLTW
ncbi:MAG: DUF4190 domain-containing protein [Pseudolysinimonas sp.]|jgi:hypothetical protein|uniref:DUF4190 domain-containing protein n=1 Tax=Pseudolysinimonas sp. TaxID=2680009 RepID=UPI003C740C95